MSDCLFCRIIKGEIPALKVYEDADTFAFLDISPTNIGHTLVVPKAHHENCAVTPDATMAALIAAAKRVAHAALAATGAVAYNIGINCGEIAGQVIMHTHVHVIPRFEGDGLVHWPKRDVTKEELEKTAAEIRAKL